MQALSASPRLTNWASFRPMGVFRRLQRCQYTQLVVQGSEGAKESPNNGKMLKNEDDIKAALLLLRGLVELQPEIGASKQPVYTKTKTSEREKDGGFVQIADAEPAGCIMDLCGNTFHGGNTDCNLSLPSKAMICNGTLELGTGKVTGTACKVTMENLEIKGGNQSCVVDVSSFSSVTMLNCKVEGKGDAAVQLTGQACLIAERCDLYSSQGSGLLVQKGGQAMLRACESSGNKHLGALVVDKGSYLLAHSSIFDFNALGNVKACFASLLLSSCRLNGSKALGLHVTDKANGTATACSISGNHQGNVSVNRAASLFLDGCECNGSYGDGWQVEGEMSWLVARQSVAKNNLLDNASESAGGKCICLDACDLGGKEICKG